MAGERQIDPVARARVQEASRRLQAVLEGRIPTEGPKCGSGSKQEIMKYYEECRKKYAEEDRRREEDRKKEVSTKSKVSGAKSSSNLSGSLVKVANLKRKSPDPEDRGNDSEASTDVDDPAFKRQKALQEDTPEAKKKARKRRPGKGARKRGKGKKKAITPTPNAPVKPAELSDSLSEAATASAAFPKKLIAQQWDSENEAQVPFIDAQVSPITASFPRTTEPFPDYQENPEDLARYISENFPQSSMDHLFHSPLLSEQPPTDLSMMAPTPTFQGVEMQDQELSILVGQVKQQASITPTLRDIEMQDWEWSVSIPQLNQQANTTPIQRDIQMQDQVLGAPTYQVNQQASIPPNQRAPPSKALALLQSNPNVPTKKPMIIPTIQINGVLLDPFPPPPRKPFIVPKLLINDVPLDPPPPPPRKPMIIPTIQINCVPLDPPPPPPRKPLIIPTILVNDVPLEQLSYGPIPPIQPSAPPQPPLFTMDSLTSLLASCGLTPSSNADTSPASPRSATSPQPRTLLPSPFDHDHNETQEARSARLPDEWVQAEKEDEERQRRKRIAEGESPTPSPERRRRAREAYHPEWLIEYDLHMRFPEFYPLPKQPESWD